MAVLSALLALFVAGTAKEAGAYGEEPPTQKLFHKGERVQVTKDHTYSWHYYWSEGSQWVHIRNTPNPDHDWPKADKVKPWSKIRVKILSSKRPDYYMIKYYTEVGKGGKPKGEAKHVAKTVYPIRGPQGKVTAWGTAFRVYKPQTHYYLVFRAGWEQDEGSEKSYGRSGKLANLVTTHW